jgi:hypothetical protein
MLLADKESLVAESKVRLLNIQNIELDYHVDNCLSIGLQAALIGGMAYNGVIEIDDAWLRDNQPLRCAYYVVTYVAFFAEVMTRPANRTNRSRARHSAMLGSADVMC